MIHVLLAAFLAQSPTCGPGTGVWIAAAQRVEHFDLPAALDELTNAPACPAVEIARAYLRGLIAARAAYRLGGSPESLEPVRRAVSALSARTGQSPVAEIAIVMLRAASAAAQSEREEMGLLLEHADYLEQKQRSVGAPGAPLVSVAEMAGDLWLQVHRFDDARQAYKKAEGIVGRTSRVLLGLARTSARVNVAAACAEYRELVATWPRAAGGLPELVEARQFLARRDCRAASPRSR